MLDEFIGRSFRHCSLEKPTFKFSGVIKTQSTWELKSQLFEAILNIEENAKDNSENDIYSFPFEKLCDFLSDLDEEIVDSISNDFRNVKLKAVVKDRIHLFDVLFYEEFPSVIVTLPFQVPCSQ